LHSNTLLFKEVVGYSKTSFRGRWKTHDIILLYTIDSKVYELWDNWYSLPYLKSLFDEEGYAFLGAEKYRFKVLGLFIRRYKYVKT
jgi:hypothetical protein